MPIVSIIVPVYNSSKTIERCINSLINQTLDDIEIICVDDCSNDQSIEIIRTITKNDPRVKIIAHNTNLGTLKTRYDGVISSTGKYVMFIDADDEYTLDACEKLTSIIKETNADMLQFGTKLECRNEDFGLVGWYESFLKPCDGPLFNNEIFIKQFNGMCWHIWNRIYDSELCRKAYYEAGDNYHIFSDDIYVSFFLSYYSKHFESVIDKYYIYHVDIGLSNLSSNESKLKICCENSSFIYKCINFLKQRGKYELISQVCFKEPLLQMQMAFDFWRYIDDVDKKVEGMKLLENTWGNGLFYPLFKEFVSKYNNNVDSLSKSDSDEN